MGRCASRRATRTTVPDRRAPGVLNFEASLEVSVDGTHAHVRGDGSALVIESADPTRLLRNLAQATGVHTRRQLGTLADGLASQGASVHVEGPRGRLLTIGAAADSFVVGALMGSRHVAPRWRTLTSTIDDPAKRRRRLAALAGLAGLVIAALALG